MSIDKEKLEERMVTIQGDMNAAKERMAEYERKKQEDVALLNALAGALQQCSMFMEELDNEISDDGNDKKE
tara:strand:- start:210 stop:422 length:213 start_codon:yes stop_codon:yes gene_type:complete